MRLAGRRAQGLLGLGEVLALVRPIPRRRGAARDARTLGHGEVSMRMSNKAWSLVAVGVLTCAVGCCSDSDDGGSSNRGGAAGDAGELGGGAGAELGGAAGDAGELGGGSGAELGGAAGDAGETGGGAGAGAELGGAAGDDGNPPEDSADPEGVYENEMEESVHITSETWTKGDNLYVVEELSLEGDFVIVHNDEGNGLGPGLYSRFDWATDEDGLFRYCPATYFAESVADAKAVEASDRTDWKKGCQGAGWSELVPPAIVGTYTDDYGGGHTVTAKEWVMDGAIEGRFDLLELSNEQRYVLAENAGTNPYSAGLYSRFDWADIHGELYFCQTVYDAASLADARDATPPDEVDPDSGCGGFAWSKLITSE